MAVRDKAIYKSMTEQIFNSAKRNVTLYRATKTTSNVTGTENLSYDSGTEVQLVFFRTETTFEWVPEGLLEKGDAFIFDKDDNLNLERNDKIVADGQTFLIKKVVPWYSQGVKIYTACTACLVE